jgi:hypothetical protein
MLVALGAMSLSLFSSMTKAETDSIEIPVYDVDATCHLLGKVMAKKFGNKDENDNNITMDVANCITSEQSSYDDIKQNYWQRLPVSYRKECVERSNKVYDDWLKAPLPQSYKSIYGHLHWCLLMISNEKQTIEQGKSMHFQR